jgi:hypothetical protein
LVMRVTGADYPRRTAGVNTAEKRTILAAA